MAVPADLAAALSAFIGRDVILVASDFDGVLAPFVQDPLSARALDGTIEDLARLAALPRTFAAVVSGRELAVLDELTGLDRDDAVTRIGTHGAQSSRAPGTALERSQATLLDRITVELQHLVGGDPGARLETKPTAAVVHTRGMEPGRACEVEWAALEVAARHTGVQVLHGKDVVELGVVRADKGTALMGLAREVAAQAVAYLGDDVTDEFAFRAMRPHDVSVKIGPGDTAARFRLDSAQDVPALLHDVHEQRAAAVAG